MRTFVKIDRWFSSYRRCRNYGNIVDKLPVNTRKWDFPKCGANHDRDINSAINIWAAGLAASVCRANVKLNKNTSVG
ncbi:transposase [Tychonema sp. LEGE 07199]|uniref:zinc ribbon domain-containing protein n=1 Tax=Tychonema sp. LEGE 07196 TaxID=1828665 RepID=UPI00187E6A59|nr:transposase [Tychonema sp. LEGE 07199]MBE9133430.1 transposase [Tychonema sp. LEGE 07196]